MDYKKEEINDDVYENVENTDDEDASCARIRGKVRKKATFSYLIPVIDSIMPIIAPINKFIKVKFKFKMENLK